MSSFSIQDSPNCFLNYDPIQEFDQEDQNLLFSHLNDKGVIKAILKYGKNPAQKSALYFALIHEDKSSAITLIEAGAKIDREIYHLIEKINDQDLLQALSLRESSDFVETHFCMNKVELFFKTYYELVLQNKSKVVITKVKSIKNPSFEIQLDSNKVGHVKTRDLITYNGRTFYQSFDVYDEKSELVGTIRAKPIVDDPEILCEIQDLSHLEDPLMLIKQNEHQSILISSKSPTKGLAQLKQLPSTSHIDTHLYCYIQHNPILIYFLPVVLCEALF